MGRAALTELSSVDLPAWEAYEPTSASSLSSSTIFFFDAGFAGLGMARGAIGGAFEVPVAQTAAPAAQQLDQLAVIAHFGQILPGVGVVDNGAAGDIDYDVLAVAAATAVLGAALAVAGKYMASEFER